ncbi:conserved hypothetical protein [Ricinus communis]|uniref:DUF7731 domain-containing protein n=1 Tax=Ricinus communis TaxID=3988 RepID=B9SD91_RICCO|nr:conserved hypothetical protein [Ricinus communis]
MSMIFSKACTSPKDVLTLDGVLNVSTAEIGDYCSKGCADHTKNVLTCISYVKRDFWFSNGASVRNLTDSINDGCATNSTINTKFKSSATRTLQNLLVPLVASLVTASIVIIFNM